MKNDDGNVDVDALEEEKILARLESAFGGDGKKVVKVSVRNNSITVGYNPYYVTTSQLGKSIDKALDGGVATVTSDGGADGLWALDAMKGGIQDTIELQETSVAWPVIISGIFCLLSFLG